LADAKRATEVLVSLAVPSRERVLERVARAADASATTPRPPQDHGFTFQQGFHDLDGHAWEIFWMDTEKAGATR
jgi:hypothetical protein